MNSMEKKTYTREQIAQRIIDHGDLLIIHSNKVYRLNSWIKHHPGGDMVILHMVGKVSVPQKFENLKKMIFFSGCNR